MSTLKIHKTNKKLLKTYNAHNTYDENINKLIDEVKEYLPVVNIDIAPTSSIKIEKETLERLDSYKLTISETYENVILRMLLVSQSLNSNYD